MLIKDAFKRGGFIIGSENCPCKAVRAELKYELSEETWLKFFYSKRPIRARHFNAFCNVLGLNPIEVALRAASHQLEGAPLELNFYGRTEELDKLEQWIVTDRCRIVFLHGLGGMGKTLLAERLARRIQNQFDRSTWRDFSYTEPIEGIITDLVIELRSQTSATPEIELRQSLPQQMVRLLQALNERRTLIVLHQAVEYEEPAESSQLQQLFKYFSLRKHRSCILVVTRNEHSEISSATDEVARSYELKGLDVQATHELLSAKGLTVDELMSQQLRSRYDGNPLALKLAASSILRDYSGHCEQFLTRTMMIPDRIEAIFREQWQHLDRTQQEILISLAKSEVALPKEELRSRLSLTMPEYEFDRAIAKLERRSLLELVSEGSSTAYILQLVLKKLIQRKRLE
ncbi:NB-ARC domain-containing protein [Leptolyngbya sp. AN03gr2]|uniref:NB-ARC domain-containing protein n=1 Tax=unclassified Leptolyngbya TaxID=2650499 RepID=UPI003D314C40